MNLKNEAYVVPSISRHGDSVPSQVDSGANLASNVIQEASTARRERVVAAVLNHCKVSKQQNEALGIKTTA